MPMALTRDQVVAHLKEMLEDKNVHTLDDDDLAVMYCAATGRVEGMARDMLEHAYHLEESDDIDGETTMVFAG